jgi:hypothetical protein
MPLMRNGCLKVTTTLRERMVIQRPPFAKAPKRAPFPRQWPPLSQRTKRVERPARCLEIDEYT